MSKRKCREQNHTSYYERTLMREAMRDHLMEINPTYFVTLASNFNTISLVSMKKKLRNWDEMPLLNWSTVMYRKRRTENGEQAAQARGNSSEVAAG